MRCGCDQEHRGYITEDVNFEGLPSSQSLRAGLQELWSSNVPAEANFMSYSGSVLSCLTLDTLI